MKILLCILEDLSLLFAGAAFATQKVLIGFCALGALGAGLIIRLIEVMYDKKYYDSSTH